MWVKIWAGDHHGFAYGVNAFGKKKQCLIVHRGTGLEELRVYLPTHDLNASEIDMSVTVVWDPESYQPCKQTNFGYSAGGEVYHDFFRSSPHLATKEELQAAGFKEITSYRDIGDDQLYGRYALVPSTRRKDNKPESGYILLGWLSMTTSHPLLFKFFSMYMSKEHYLCLTDGTKIDAESDYTNGQKGGDGIFWAWITRENLEVGGVEKLEETQLRIELWNTATKQLFDTLIFS